MDEQETRRRNYYCPPEKTMEERSVGLAAWVASSMDRNAMNGVASSVGNVLSLGVSVVTILNAALTAPEWARAIVDATLRDEADTAEDMGGLTIEEATRDLIENFPMALLHPVEA
jgi:hypothetical protein